MSHYILNNLGIQTSASSVQKLTNNRVRMLKNISTWRQVRIETYPVRWSWSVFSKKHKSSRVAAASELEKFAEEFE